MTISAALLMLLMALALGGAVTVYERLLRQTRDERDEAIADCELFSQLLIDNAIARHPASLQSTNVRVLRSVK